MGVRAKAARATTTCPGDGKAFPAAWLGPTRTGDATCDWAEQAPARTHERPLPRPALPVALLCLPAAWAGVELADACDLAAHFGTGGPSWHMAGVMLAALALACAPLCRLRRRMGMTLAAMACALAAGLLCGHVRLGSTLTSAQRMPERPVSSYELVLTTDASPTSRGGKQAQADVLEADGGDERRVGTAWVRLPSTAPQDALYVGARLRAVGRWGELEDDDWGRSMLARGLGASITLTRVTQTGFGAGPLDALRRARAQMLAGLDETDPGLALAAGVALGHQAGFASCEAHDWFSNLGLSHLVAVSGTHLAVVAGMLEFALARTRARPAVRLAGTSLALAAYVVLTGVQPSAVRAFAMVVCGMTGRLAGRRSHALAALGTAALGMLLVDPSLGRRLGFQLSVASVLGIACLGRLAGRWASAALPAGFWGPVGEAAAVSLVAQACTLPLTLPTFGTLPVLSPVANVLVAPLASALVTLGVVAIPLGTLVPALAGALFGACSLVGNGVCALAGGLAALPYAAVPLTVAQGPCAAVACVALAATYVVWPQPTARRARTVVVASLALVVATLGVWRLGGPTRVCVLDVGQGDAILVQQGPHAVLVDTGPDDAVVKALGRQHVIHLDAVLLTHTDADHAGGLAELEGLVRVDEVILAEGVPEQALAEKPELESAIKRLARHGVREVVAGDVIRAGAFSLEVIWPRTAVGEESNGTSVVCVARYREGGGDAVGMDVLLTGDAEGEQVEPLARSGAVGRVDVLKVGHHGSAVSTTPEMLRALRPELAVISAGAGNRYGHPTDACLDTLAGASVPELCTIDHGDVDVRPAANGVRVRTQR